MTRILISLIAGLHFYFLILEMFLWTKPLGLKTFHMSLQKALDSKALAANQGLYNGFLSAGLLWSLLAPADFAIQIAAFFLSCVLLAGIVGALTVSRRIFWIQGLPAGLALLGLVFRI